MACWAVCSALLVLSSLFQLAEQKEVTEVEQAEITRNLLGKTRHFIRQTSVYDQLHFAPGSEACWQTPFAVAAGLNFERCCVNGTTARRPPCSRGSSFAECCTSEALRKNRRPPAYQNKFRAVVVMTSIPDRLIHLESVILSLAQQSRKPDAIYLCLPMVFSRNWAFYDHPWWYAQTAREFDVEVRIVRCDQDFRSSTSVLCMLQYETAPDTRLLVVDDDQVYHPLLLERLLEHSERSPGAVVGAQAYHRPGITCKAFDLQGACVVPNLIHTTYGILFQRRFFDAGIYNFVAAADALARVQPGKKATAETRDYVIACCQVEDNVWYEAHLARKGIPRVFLSDVFEAKTIAELAFGTSALTSSEDNIAGLLHTFDHRDPRSTAEALIVCTKALAALWGPTLWPVRPRHAAVTSIQPPSEGGRSLVVDIVRFLGVLGWWRYDHAIIFTCSGRTLGQWRQLLNDEGGPVTQLHYLHYFNATAGKEDKPFVSEPFDPGAYVPEALRTENSGRFTRIFPSQHPEGRPAAGSVRPLADVVEVCPPEEAAAAAAFGAPEEGDLRRRTPCDTFQARSVEVPCADGDASSRVSLMSAGGFAGTACITLEGPEKGICFSVLNPRNDSWRVGGVKVGNCLPQFVNYYHARHICRTLHSELVTEEQLRDCCTIGGCMSTRRFWLISPEVPEDCEQMWDTPAPLPAPVSLEALPPNPAGVHEANARVRLFLNHHEEARSTVVDMVDHKSGRILVPEETFRHQWRQR
ncbi:unnamed protein product [Polarella glacialis]|uniref:Uncharacterized protein n=1 Tax=Polarella glacialis TaxID=89957 RepID=A0A813HUC8_POLGL|nr:unnamed protein product [Polarella glacialis]